MSEATATEDRAHLRRLHRHVRVIEAKQAARRTDTGQGDST